VRFMFFPLGAAGMRQPAGSKKSYFCRPTRWTPQTVFSTERGHFSESQNY
jgi:hypothetical protein